MLTAYQSSILDQCRPVIRMPLSRWLAFVGWYQIITLKLWIMTKSSKLKI